MKRILIMVILLVLFFGCKFNSMNYAVSMEFPIEYYNLSFSEIVRVCSDEYDPEIKYRRDLDAWGVKDYWQSPTQTLNILTGDCEDYAILFMFLMKINFNMELYLIILDMGYVKEDGSEAYHAVVEYNGILYSPQRQNWIIEVGQYEQVRKISYEHTMEIATSRGSRGLLSIVVGG